MDILKAAEWDVEARPSRGWRAALLRALLTLAALRRAPQTAYELFYAQQSAAPARAGAAAARGGVRPRCVVRCHLQRAASLTFGHRFC